MVKELDGHTVIPPKHVSPRRRKIELRHAGSNPVGVIGTCGFFGVRVPWPRQIGWFAAAVPTWHAVTLYTLNPRTEGLGEKTQQTNRTRGSPSNKHDSMIPSAWCRVGAPLPATNSIPREQDSRTPHPMTSFQGHPVRFELGDLRSAATLPHKFHVSGPLSYLDARPLVHVLAKERSWVRQKHLHLASTLITRAKTDISVVRSGIQPASSPNITAPRAPPIWHKTELLARRRRASHAYTMTSSRGADSSGSPCSRKRPREDSPDECLPDDDARDGNDTSQSVADGRLGSVAGQSTNFRNVSACSRCRSRKNRCDQRLPRCTSCAKVGAACVGYDALTKRELPRRCVVAVLALNPL